MAATITDKKELYKQYEFHCGSLSDISDLPTTTTGGSGSLAYITEPIKPGSTAIIQDIKKVYMLNDNGEWEEF